MEAVGGAAALGGALFQYNRKNFMYDRELRQETEYNVMEFRIAQADLWRDDVREIIELTSVKTDTYLIVMAIELGMCVMAFCEGRMELGTPRWLLGAYVLSLGGAFMYLLIGMWLAIHASVTSKMYKVRLLTQECRLPMPTWASLEGARTYGSAFERLEANQMFRVPFAMGAQQDVAQGSMARSGTSPGAASGGDVSSPPKLETSTGSSADPWALEGRGDHIYELDGRNFTDPDRMRHLGLVRMAMPQWQSYDGFARAAMSVGTTHLAHALSYYVLGYVLLSNHCLFAAWLVVMLLMAVLIELIRMDMSLSKSEFYYVAGLMVAGPTLLGFACAHHMVNEFEDLLAVRVATPSACVAHALYLIFLMTVCRVREHRRHSPKEVFLPLGFRSVMYIDIFGWIHRRMRSVPNVAVASPVAGGGESNIRGSPTPRVMNGCGPASEAVCVERGQPKLARPEELPGAAPPVQHKPVREDAFDDASFVPAPELDGSGAAEEGENVIVQPGKTPSRIFYGTTVLLILMWLAVGFGVLLESMGVNFFVGRQLLDAPEDESDNAADDEKLYAPIKTQLRGFPIETTWPKHGGHPQSLACGIGHDGKTWLVAAGQLHMVVAKSELDSDGDDEVLDFKAAPPCQAVQGQPIQDVAVQCNAHQRCHALVLPKRGQRLAACALAGASEGEEEHVFLQHRESPWLGERAAADTGEVMTSFAVTGQCNGTSEAGSKMPCAYMGLSSDRVVEMRSGAIAGGSIVSPGSEHRTAAERAWLPARSLRMETGDGTSSGATELAVVKGHLLAFHPRERLLVEVKTGAADIGHRSSWQLPAGHKWTAVCSAGENIFAAATGPLPRIWRFDLPGELLRPMHTVSQEPAGSKKRESDHEAIQFFQEESEAPVSVNRSKRLRHTHSKNPSSFLAAGRRKPKASTTDLHLRQA